MANNCYYEMKVCGNNEAIFELMEMLQWKGRYENDGLGRVFSVEVYESGSGYLCISGDCAWSIYSSMIDTGSRNLLDESKRLGLTLEAYSSECGLCFQEHYLICNGEMIIDDEVEYCEYWVEDMEAYEQKEIANDLHITVEELVNGVNENGYYTAGGYENFGDFTKIDSIYAPRIESGLTSAI